MLLHPLTHFSLLVEKVKVTVFVMGLLRFVAAGPLKKAGGVVCAYVLKYLLSVPKFCCPAFGLVFSGQLGNVTTENFDLLSFKNGRSWAACFAAQF